MRLWVTKSTSLQVPGPQFTSADSSLHRFPTENGAGFTFTIASSTCKLKPVTILGVFLTILTMKFCFASFALAVAPVAAFSFQSVGKTTAQSKTQLFATVEAPARVAPGAGWEPEWEDREGLPEEEFMYTDMSKPDLSGMWECPLTRWDSEG